MKIDSKKIEEVEDQISKIIEEKKLSIYEVFVLLETLRVRTMTALFDAALNSRLMRFIPKH